MKKFNVAILGIRGAVGQEMYKILKERNFPVNELRLLSSSIEEGAKEKLVGLVLEGKQAAREGSKVFSGDAQVGVVTSGSLAPSLGTAVAMAYVKSELAEPGKNISIQVRNKQIPAQVVALPFYKDGTARKAKRKSRISAKLDRNQRKSWTELSNPL